MSMFDKIKEVAAMRNMLSEMDKVLRAKVLEVDTHGVKIKINAKSEFLGLEISPELLKQDHEKIEKSVLAAVQQAVKNSQEAMAEEGKKLAGGMKLPGLM